MKFQILLLLCISLFSACQISQKAQMDGLSNTEISNQQTALNFVENKQAETKQPKPIDVSRFSSIEIKRTDYKSKFYLNIDVEFPQLKNAKTPQEVKFNRYVKKAVDEQIADFTNFLADKNKEVKSKIRHEYEINLNYQVDYFSNNFTSIVMNWNGYSGYLNMDYFPSTINYDLKNGKPVELKEIFEPNANYLEKLSELSRKILRKTCLSCGCGKGISAGDSLPEELIVEETKTSENSNTAANMFSAFGWYEGGTKPEEENFHNWSVTADGLKITFGEYQVGPGCIGIIDIVIPFSDLQPILKKDLNFN